MKLLLRAIVASWLNLCRSAMIRNHSTASNQPATDFGLKEYQKQCCELHDQATKLSKYSHYYHPQRSAEINDSGCVIPQSLFD